MPIFFQQQIDPFTRLGIWKIEENEGFFQANVPLHRDVTHPHKRLQHLAGRFLLQYLVPAFPYELVRIADTRKPFLPDSAFHFSISHCADYAAVIISSNTRVGIDVELVTPKIARIREKFLSEDERGRFDAGDDLPARLQLLTTLWSAKEAVYKWDGEGKVDFSDQIRLLAINERVGEIDCFFTRMQQQLSIRYQAFGNLVMAWVMS